MGWEQGEWKYIIAHTVIITSLTFEDVSKTQNTTSLDEFSPSSL